VNARVGALARARVFSRPLGRLDGVDRALMIGTAGTAVLNVGATLLNFAITLSLSRMLGASGFGAYAYSLAWSSLLAVPSVLGLTPLVTRNVAAYHQRKQWGALRGMLARANQAVLISSGLAIAIGVVIGFVVNGGRPELRNPYFVALLLVPVIALTSIRQAAMQGLNRVVLGRTPETLVAPALFLAFVATAYAAASDSLSATWVVALQVAASVVALVAGGLLLWRALPDPAKTDPAEYETRQWIRSALPLLVFAAVQTLNTQIEVVLLGAIKGSEDAGLLSVAARVAGIVNFVGLAASYSVSPMIARLHAAGDIGALARAVRRAALGVFVATLPIAVGVLVFARPLLALFGGEFKGGETALFLLALAQVGFAATGFAGNVLVMTGNESWLTRGMLANAVTNIGLNAVLIPLFGLNGAAVGSATSLTVMNVCLVYFARRRVGIASTALGI